MAVDRQPDLTDNRLGEDKAVDKSSPAVKGRAKSDPPRSLDNLMSVKVEPQDDLTAREEHLVEETKQIDLNEKAGQVNDHEMENGESKQKKRLIIKLSKLNNDWKPINLNGSYDKDSNQSGSSSDEDSDSSCSSSCSCDSDS